MLRPPVRRSRHHIPPPHILDFRVDGNRQDSSLAVAQDDKLAIRSVSRDPGIVHMHTNCIHHHSPVSSELALHPDQCLEAGHIGVIGMHVDTSLHHCLQAQEEAAQCAERRGAPAVAISQPRYTVLCISFRSPPDVFAAQQ